MPLFSDFVNISLETANKFYSWGWKASLIGAFITLVGVGFLMWGTRVRDHAFDSQMVKLNYNTAKAKENVATLTKDAEFLRTEALKAKKEIAVAQAQAATANSEAAKANETAESERLVRVKMEADLAPRIITITEDAINELKIFSGTNVFIQFEQYDIEANRLAGQIYNMLVNASWNILDVTPKKPSTTGMMIIGKGNIITYGSAGVEILSQRMMTGKDGLQDDNNKWTDAAKILSYILEIDNKIKTIQHALIPPSATFPPYFPHDAVLVVVDSKPQTYFKDKQRLESLAQSGMLHGFEERKFESDRSMKQRMEKEAKNTPWVREILEESKRSKESIANILERENIQKYKDHQKDEKEKILQKYKKIN